MVKVDADYVSTFRLDDFCNAFHKPMGRFFQVFCLINGKIISAIIVCFLPELEQTGQQTAIIYCLNLCLNKMKAEL